MKRFYWGILIGFFILFSFSPTLYELSEKEKLNGRSFELVHNYITDYHFYLSRIRQGMEGKWTVTERYTSEPHAGSFVQIFYLLLGKIDNHAPTMLLGATGVYHASRVVFGALILVFIALWVRFLFPSLLWQVLAFLVAVTASWWPHIVQVGDTLRLGGPMSWWTLMDSLQRITFLPHLLAGQALLLFLLFAGGDEKILERTGNWLFLGILAFVLGMVFPPGLIFVGAVYGIMILLSYSADAKSLKNKDRRNAWISTEILSRAMIGVISFPSFLYFSLILTIYPWRRLVEFDTLHPLPFQFPEYVMALGPTLPLGILGLLLVLIRKDRKFMGMAAWVIAWFVCLFVFQYIPQQSPFRFSEMLPHVPLGILTTYVFFLLWQSTKHRTTHKRGIMERIFSGCTKTVSFIGPVVLIMVGLGVMISSFFWQKDFVDQKVLAGWPVITMNNVIVYPITGVVDGLVNLDKLTPKDAVILSDMTVGNYIPPYIGRKVFVGHNNSVNLETKLMDVQLFFQGDKKDAQEWFRINGIGYIFFGPQEKEIGNVEDLTNPYPFLKEIYRNSAVILYAIQ